MGACYDNRNLREAAKLILSRRNGPLHFKLTISGKKIIYCYIRKNGCTAFKRMFVDQGSRSALQCSSEDDAIEFMIRNQRAWFPRDYLSYDHLIFVYRDPVERMVSLFKNKFVEGRGNEGIYKDFFNLTGCSPLESSFRDFVEKYIGRGWRGRDGHVRPQSRHLLPVRYTDAIALENLRDSVEKILGKTVADQYFGVKSNASMVTVGRDTEKSLVSDVPAGELRKRLRNGFGMPGNKLFLDERIRGKIEEIYSEDVALVERLTTER